MQRHNAVIIKSTPPTQPAKAPGQPQAPKKQRPALTKLRMPTAADLASTSDESKEDKTMKGPFVFNAAVLNVHFHCDNNSDDEDWYYVVLIIVLVFFYYYMCIIFYQ